MFLGQPGCGKTHLAVALAIKAVEAGYRGYFTTADDLVVTLARARTEGTWATKLRIYTAPTVLVVDDVGLLPMTRDGASAFFHVISHRYENTRPHPGHDQPGLARLGLGLRRRCRRLRRAGPSFAPGRGVQHPRPVLAHTGTPHP